MARRKGRSKRQLKKVPATPPEDTAAEPTRTRRQQIIIWVGGVLFAGIATYITLLGTEAVKKIIAPPEDIFESEPFKVVAVRPDYDHGTDYLVIPDTDTPQDVARIKAEAEDNFSAERLKWMAQRDIYEGNYANWLIDLEGRMSKPVTILNIKPIIENRKCASPIQKAVLIDEEVGGAGEQKVINLTIDFDKATPLFYEEVNGARAKRPYFSGSAVTLKRDEIQSLAIRSSTSTKSCAWRLGFSYIYDGERREKVVGAPHNEPFRITAVGREDSYEAMYTSRLYCKENIRLDPDGMRLLAKLRKEAKPLDAIGC